VLALFNVALAGLYAAAVTLYAMTVVLASAVLAVRAGDPGMLPWLPLAFAAIHGGAGAGLWQELIAGWLGRRATRRVRNHALAPTLRFYRAAQTAQVGVLGSRANPGPVLNALTIDVEDYYHVSAFEKCVKRADWGQYESRVVASTRRILDLLDECGVRATFFVLGWVADQHPELVRAIHAAGHEVGCHGYWHRLIYEQTPDAFREDLCRARDALQDITGERVSAYRAPSFSVTKGSLWALDVLIEEGFTIDSSIYPTRHDRYGLAGAPREPHRVVRPAGELWEFPMPVCRVLGYPLPVGGGGYFRLYPYALTRRGLRAINARGLPFATYLHPWELDPEQPRLAVGRLKAFRHYVNLRRTEGRLVRLLSNFKFGTMTAALAAFRCESLTTDDLRRAA
jgi:polysaccharide deacetylase family protein (PEP-CTERM system associated)